MRTSTHRLCFVCALLFIANRAPAQATELSASEQSALADLEARQIHQFTGHAELAEYMRLRAKERGRDRLEPADAVVHYALKTIGQPYQRNAWSEDLSQASCVTFTERCLALACADDWQSARKLQYRLRYRSGSGAAADLNHEPVLEWAPANAWLLDEITGSFGVELAEYEAYSRSATQRVSYISKEALPPIGEHFRAGDILLIIADAANPPFDPAMKTRCAHMAIVNKPDETSPLVEIVHSYPPAASRWPLERLLRNRYVRGVKVLRLKPFARSLAAAELTQLSGRFEASVNQVDNQARLHKGELGFLKDQRQPDATVIIDGIEYGAVRIKPGETLWRLFGRAYQGICNLPANREFMVRHLGLKAEEYAGDTIYYPRRPAGDNSDDPAPPGQNRTP